MITKPGHKICETPMKKREKTDLEPETYSQQPGNEPVKCSTNVEIGSFLAPLVNFFQSRQSKILEETGLSRGGI